MAFSSQAFFATSIYHLPPNKTTSIIIGDSNKLINLTTPRMPSTCTSTTSQKWSIAHHNFPLVTPLQCPDDYLSKFHSYDQDDMWMQHGQKLEVFRHVLSKVGEDPFEGLKMIDAVQRLGIDYYFEDEIEAILQKQYMIFSADDNRDCQYGLHEVALRFRLLRQQGYFVPSDIFSNFKDNKQGIVDKKLCKDIKGLMGLFEASHLSTEGEDLLDEAGNFSGKLLAKSMANLNQHHARAVATTLGNPHHKILAKFMAKKYFFSDSQGSNGWINVLQQVAKTEFNVVQSLHRNEIVQISKWWRDLGLSKELKFARDQPLKWYIWSMVCLTDPSLSEERIELTKPISFIYMIDDIFDVYGTLDELTLFTKAVNRWDIGATEQLPDYMKMCFKALYDMTNEISHKIHQNHGSNPLRFLRKTWAILCNAFLEEAKWFASGKVPKAEDYLKNGIISSGVHVVLVHVLFLLGEGLNDTVELMDDMPRIMSSTAAILRLWDDLGSAKDENQDGHDGSYLECYMKENKGSSMEEARQHTMSMISNAWKSLNKECLSPTPFPLKFTKASLNLARLVPLMYSYDDNQCLPSLEEHMKSMLYETVAM